MKKPEDKSIKKLKRYIACIKANYPNLYKSLGPQYVRYYLKGII
jgi:hypothetical protein